MSSLFVMDPIDKQNKIDISEKRRSFGSAVKYWNPPLISLEAMP